MQQKVIFQDKKYLYRLIESWIIRSINHTPEDLLIFLDETGNPKLNDQHPVFGVGGCATSGLDYQSFVKPVWQDIKFKIFGLSARDPFHASYHLNKASDEQIEDIAQFLVDPRIKKFSVIIDRHVRVNDSSRGLDAVLSSLQGLVNELASRPFALDHWIFEHSDTISRLCLVNMIERGSNYFHMRGSGETSGGLSFIRKKMAEPGLEISDLIMYLVGLRSREAPSYRCVYDKILGAAFDDRKIGLSSRLGSVFGPIWVAPQPDGTSRVIQPPTLTLTILKGGARAERQRRERERYGDSHSNNPKQNRSERS